MRKKTVKRQKIVAVSLLKQAIDDLGGRAVERDTGEERSMTRAVKAFNDMYGTEMTDEMGWMFMVFLKASRARGGSFRVDDYADGASYFSLAGEAASVERD